MVQGYEKPQGGTLLGLCWNARTVEEGKAMVAVIRDGDVS